MSTPIVNRSLNVLKNQFRPYQDNKAVICLEVPYISAISDLIYLTNYTQQEKVFTTNLLAGH